MAHLYAVSRNTAVRRTLPRLTVCAALLSLCALPAVTAHGAPPPASAPAAPGPAVPTPRVLQTDDNWGIYITFFPAPGDREVFTKEAPVVILLHGDKQNRLVWEGEKRSCPSAAAGRFCRDYGRPAQARAEHKRRPGIGDSPAGGKSHRRHQPAVRRLSATWSIRIWKRSRNFIYEQHQAKRLNMNKIGIVAAETSAAVAALCRATTGKKSLSTTPLLKT